MDTDKPSRRRLLCGFAAGLFGWLLVRKGREARLAAAASRVPPPYRHTGGRIYSCDQLGSVTTYTYDAVGRLVGVRTEPCEPSVPPVCSYSVCGGVTTFTYAPRPPGTA